MSDAVCELPTPYDPGIDAQSVEDLDGIDLDEGEGCPHCGGRRDNLYCPNAGYYACSTCGAVWAGDREDASLHEEPHSGPVVQEGMAVREDAPVEIPAWVAEESLQEFDFLIKRTGGDGPEDAVTPLALLQQRLEDLDSEGIDEFTLRHVQQHLEGVAEQRGVQLGDVDPLTSRTFEARDELEDALDDPSSGETTMLSGDSEIVECVACGTTGIAARVQPTACPHDTFAELVPARPASGSEEEDS